MFPLLRLGWIGDCLGIPSLHFFNSNLNGILFYLLDEIEIKLVQAYFWKSGSKIGPN